MIPDLGHVLCASIWFHSAPLDNERWNTGKKCIVCDLRCSVRRWQEGDSSRRPRVTRPQGVIETSHGVFTHREFSIMGSAWPGMARGKGVGPLCGWPRGAMPPPPVIVWRTFATLRPARPAPRPRCASSLFLWNFQVDAGAILLAEDPLWRVASLGVGEAHSAPAPYALRLAGR